MIYGMFAAEMVIIIGLIVVEIQNMKKDEKIVGLIANLSAEVARLKTQDNKPVTFEDKQAEAMERIFEEWQRDIVNYNPYRKDDE